MEDRRFEPLPSLPHLPPAAGVESEADPAAARARVAAAAAAAGLDPARVDDFVKIYFTSLAGGAL
ncbi:MAG: hypothetical protein HY804_08840 [Nitrospinae bacterium]|nr:hypothetical protein [Nitrospinota bacterium]